MKAIGMAFLIGMTFGGLIGISLKYPMKAATYEDASKLCAPYLGVNRVKVGLSGKIYTVICNKDGKKFNTK